MCLGSLADPKKKQVGGSLNSFQLMANLRVSEWRKLPMSLTELCIETTLRCGQSFRWKKLRDNEW
jgi:hypothetical protein